MRVVVSGDSMRPAFQPGDRLLVGPAGRVRAGHVVAVPDPRDGRLVIKRVRAVVGAAADVRGDREAASTDSRTYGPVPIATIAGRVWYRYGPRDRVGFRPD